jgi:hypothetical protein
MSVTMDYWTTAKINADLQRKLEAAASKFVRGRRWWAESLNFFTWPGKDGQLAGSTKFSRSDADPEDDMFMADVDMLAILEQLAAWSTEFGVDWELQLAGDPWGMIRAGKFDAQLKKFCAQAKKSIGKPAQAAQRITEVFREYDGEPVAAPATQSAKDLQARWTKKLVAAINKFIVAEESTADLLRNNRMPRRTLPPGLVPTSEEAGIAWHDLRGFPTHHCNALLGDHIDFSYCKMPKPKRGPDLGIIMTNCQLTDCRFIGSGPFYSCGDQFLRCDFTSAKLRGTIMLGGSMVDCNFTRADMGRIEPHTAKFERCLFDGTRFCNAEIDMTTKFTDCVFRSCDWSGAYLPGIRFKGCDVRGENFVGTECPRSAFDARCQTDGIQLG